MRTHQPHPPRATSATASLSRRLLAALALAALLAGCQPGSFPREPSRAPPPPIENGNAPSNPFNHGQIVQIPADGFGGG